MKTGATIRRLVDDLRPVSPLRPLAARLAQWSVVVMAVLGLEIVVALARGAELSGLTRATLLYQAILPISVALVAARGAFGYSIPGRARPSLLVAALLLFMLWAGLLATAVAGGPSPSFTAWMAAPAWRCAAHIAASGLPGGLALLWLVRAGAVLNGVQAGILIALAAGAAGALATQLTCPNLSAAHLLLWHAGSVLAFAITGIGMSRPLTSWMRVSRC
jgi:hypothetical protein